ncbi:hypothetical protein [Actinomyces glycerinitolerans]|uniref:Uncharacterized protein n=1 Tax=Actinomyces glycerinitolerans TaxID=1892869 RepID=A0A1M4RWA1_9ACTO|nr:hypothetical protein [Actinomyces glycerinitolerans]SHE24258.1 Hypothetical protein ACGLYG10_0458 [Actinomyces glycerinitolerans]
MRVVGRIPRRSLVLSAGIVVAASLSPDAVAAGRSDLLQPVETSSKVIVPTEPIEVDGVLLGAEEGLRLYSFEGEFVSGGQNQLNASTASPAGYAPYESKKISWGASYVRNEQIALLSYRGSTYAAANVYAGKRIICTVIKYRRSGKELASATSNARVVSGRWAAGYVKVALARDNLTINGVKTEWAYDYYGIAPGVTP